MTAPSGRILVLNDVRVDLDNETLTRRSGAAVALRPQAFAVLRHLAENANRLVGKDELMAEVWPGLAVTDDSLVQAIGDIRRAIGDDRHAVLRTVPRRGYKLAPPGEAPPEVRSRRRWPLVGAAALLLAVVVSGWGMLGRGGEVGRSLHGPPIVAVLRFANVTGREATGAEVNAYDAVQRLCLGLTSGFGTVLAQFREFHVVLRDTTYLHGDPLADGLEVDFILAGSANQEGGRLLVKSQLTDARTGEVMWSERWDRPASDMLAAEIEIADEIANRLGGGGGVIRATERAAAHGRRPGRLTGYELYLLGSERLEQPGAANAADAVRLLGQAVGRDPEYARAWADLSLAHALLADYGVAPDDNRRAATDAAERAVTLGPTDAKAHVALGTTLRHAGNLVRARSEFETALGLAPNAGEVLAHYAGWAATGGDPEAGADLVDRAARLDPEFPTWQAEPFAHAKFMAGRYGEALAMTDRLAPETYAPATWAIRAGALAATGRNEEARAAVAAARAAYPDLTIERMAYDPRFGPAERRRFVETMRLAGFPPCVAPGTPPPPRRLPECAPLVRTATP